ncbi:MAG: folylpolyglutamate synthase/dihydrofolate synthase family protein [Actinomycetota bacterium]|nr:bifunctional folylpolyglutamate synthase/dihydrofolate synthase [Chloroflexota bacterium]
MPSTSYRDAVRYLDALGIDAMKSMAPSLHRMEAVADVLAHPERSLPAIHVTGTNGKTTTARVVASLLEATGLSVATFTSPHLQAVNERINVGGCPLDEEEFAAAFDAVLPYVKLAESELGERLTYFEVLTAMFFMQASERAGVAVVEVGLGGRWDATNIVDAPVSIVTNVAVDHAALLGADRVTIAREKVGIIKQGAAVVTAERAPDVLDVIEREADQRGATVARIDRDFSVTANDVAVGGRLLSVTTSAGEYSDLYVPLHGPHQGPNVAVALEAVTRFLAKPLDQDLVAEGLAGVEVPGRLETIRLEDRSVVLDVAHNPDGMAALVRALAGAFAFERVVAVFGALDDKDHAGMLSELARLPVRLILTQPRNDRAVPVAALARAADAQGLAHEERPDVPSALEAALADDDPGALPVVTGSHYVVGEARTHLLQRA